jgi:hypothetical protein
MTNDVKPRRRMVVEEVGAPAAEAVSAAETVNSEPVEEIKQKVEELQNLTEDISQSAEKSADVQEEIAKAAEEVVQQEPAPIMPMPEIKRRNGPNPIAIIIPGIFLLGALLGGIYFYQQRTAGVAQPTPTPPTTYDNEITGSTTPTSPNTTATPSATAQVDLTKYPINIMNGSGIAGQAGVVKNLLTTAGFTVSATGNASSYGFTKTVIKAKSDVPAALLTQLSTLLSKSYVLDTNQALATSSADEIQIIVGYTKAQ